MSNTFKPFVNQRMGGPQVINTGYTSSDIRLVIRNKYKDDVLGAIHATLKASDDFLYHQFYLRDMAYTCLEAGNVEEAKEWLAKIGEDK